MNIEITQEVNPANIFTANATRDRKVRTDITIMDRRRPFLNLVNKFHPQGLSGKTFLDGAYKSGPY